MLVPAGPLTTPAAFRSGVSIRDTSRAKWAVTTPPDYKRTPSKIGYEIQINNRFPDSATSTSAFARATPGTIRLMAIRILITGGTFDKEYDEIHGRLFFQDSHLPEMLALGRCRLKVEVRTLMMIDSLEMAESDRELIAEQCRAAPEQRVVITHGTDTMAETARILAGKGLDKTIVLTGAMVPYKFGSSDGLFNLGSALAFAQTLEPGVYVAMNGRYFRAGGVRKNRETGIFEEM